MVDLGFLLISFFIFSAEITKPRAMDLLMPKEGNSPTELCQSCALTLLLEGKRNYFYEGSWEQAREDRSIREVTIKGLRDQILRKQREMEQIGRFGADRDDLMILIKPSSEASYKTLVDVLDEAVICEVRKYAILPLFPEENEWLRQRK